MRVVNQQGPIIEQGRDLFSNCSVRPERNASESPQSRGKRFIFSG